MHVQTMKLQIMNGNPCWIRFTINKKKQTFYSYHYTQYYRYYPWGFIFQILSHLRVSTALIDTNKQQENGSVSYFDQTYSHRNWLM